MSSHWIYHVPGFNKTCFTIRGFASSTFQPITLGLYISEMSETAHPCIQSTYDINTIGALLEQRHDLVFGVILKQFISESITKEIKVGDGSQMS